LFLLVYEEETWRYHHCHGWTQFTTNKNRNDCSGRGKSASKALMVTLLQARHLDLSNAVRIHSYLDPTCVQPARETTRHISILQEQIVFILQSCLDEFAITVYTFFLALLFGRTVKNMRQHQIILAAIKSRNISPTPSTGQRNPQSN
jgi:hypothetical protein